MPRLNPDNTPETTTETLPGNNNGEDEDKAGDGGEPDTPPDCEEVVEVDPDEADALVDQGIDAAA